MTAVMLAGYWRWQLYAGSCSLLARSIRVLDRGDLTPYRWINDHELLLFEPLVGHAAERWHLMRLNVETGRKTPLDALSALLPHRSDVVADALLSPDGRWLLWRDRRNICAAHLDGTCRRSWLDVADTEGIIAVDYSIRRLYWQWDSHHIVQLQLRNVDNVWHSCYVGAELIRDVDSPSNISLHTLPRTYEFEGDYFDRPRLTSTNILYAKHLRDDGIGVMLLTRPLSGEGQPHTYLILAPDGTRFAQGALNWYDEPLALTSNNDRVVWICFSAPVETPIQALMRRFTPNIVARTSQNLGLYVTHFDGSSVSSLGTVQLAGGDLNSDVMHDVRWLPSGKFISFIFDHELYRVPVE
jgi:hypothetical protein